MNVIGASLVNLSTGEELQNWSSVPAVISHGGEDRSGAIIGSEFSGGCLLVERICEPAPFGSPPVVSESSKFDGEKVVVTRVYGEIDLAPIRGQLVSSVKANAASIILAYCPQYKQANLTARAAELALTYPGTAGIDLPEPYKSEWLAGSAIWNYIKAVRAHSNTLEAEINKISTADELKNWQPHDWPTP